MRRTSKILVVHTGGLGDLIMARPAIQVIRRNYGDSRVDFLGNTGAFPVLAKDRWITNLIPFPSRNKNIFSSMKVLLTLLRLRALRYDLLFLLQPVLSKESHNRLLFLVKVVSAGCAIGRRSNFGDDFFDLSVAEDPRLHEVQRILSVAHKGVDGKDGSFDYLLPHTFGDTQTPCAFERPYGVLAPGGAKTTRRWPIENFLEISRKFADINLDIVFVGDKSEKNILSGKKAALPSRSVDLVGKTNLEELASVVRKAKIVVANDSGTMHLANALGVPVVGIFGSGDAVRTRPYREDDSRVIDSGALECKPCYHGPCDLPVCMEGITVDRVWEAVTELIRWRN